jgi:hypothetical protein
MPGEWVEDLYFPIFDEPFRNLVNGAEDSETGLVSDIMEAVTGHAGARYASERRVRVRAVLAKFSADVEALLSALDAAEVAAGVEVDPTASDAPTDEP